MMWGVVLHVLVVGEGISQERCCACCDRPPASRDRVGGGEGGREKPDSNYIFFEVNFLRNAK
jgi:hypothetical protein